MEKSTSAVILLLALTSALILNAVVSDGPKDVESWFEALQRDKHAEEMTKLHFYFHDLQKGKKVTSAVLAQANVSSPLFGSLATGDDPMTVGPEFESKRLGFFRGLYGATSFEEFDLMTAMSFVFTEGINNGSSLSVLGHNLAGHLYREIPVVGGSGRFRLARGIVTFQTYYFNSTSGNATIEVDVVLLHY